MPELKLCTTTRIHPKIRRLKNKLGAEGVLGLYNLWCFCVEYKKDGVLSGMEDRDIAEAADYEGDYEAFLKVLVDLRLLDATGRVFAIHGWSKYNLGRVRVPKVSAASPADASPGSPVSKIVSYYRSVHPTRGKMLKPGSRDWKRIKSRLEEGFTIEELKKAVDGNKVCPWHTSHPAGYSAEYIFRNGTKVEGFIELANNGVKEQQVGHHKGSKEFTDGNQSTRF